MDAIELRRNIPDSQRPLTLEFDDRELEADYRDHVYDDQIRPSLKKVTGLLAVTGAAFAVVDVYVVPDVLELALALRLGVIVPVWVTVYLLMDRSWFSRRVYDEWAFWGTYAVVVVFYLLSAVAEEPGSWLYLTYNAIFPLSAGAIGRWRVRRSVGFNTLTLVGALLVLAVMDVTVGVAVFVVVIHAVAAVWGVIATALVESMNRTSFVQQLVIDRERARADALLVNVMPAPIAERLKAGDEIIADGAEATVLFADVVGFTRWSAVMSPGALVNYIDALFRRFDALVERHEVEKIKTIGDAYMAAAGVPDPRDDHVEAIVRLGLDMLDEIAAFSEEVGQTIGLRVGVNTGPVVAGVVGTKRFAYDLWGDTVNVASRIESLAEPGTMLATGAVVESLDGAEDLAFVACGDVDIKGRGPMAAWHVQRA